ncbi:hypothetical protein [Paludibacterium purpuratum]|uniref:SmpA/OmlA family protein n=1 Tax=Paludibacterium purpuratum TaxID=1144873 RepID=A0A4R7BCN2_9NEIS|nr:hypothetical protein [Paludibacterium purpuratum]TDR81912.1 hypothetical protein DFP86_10222 [Paludibacterium purpuratum]
MIKIKTLILLAPLLLPAMSAYAETPQSASAPVADHPAGCPDTISGFVDGKVKAEEVQRCMGKPINENHNPDGRFIYMYGLNENQVVAFLFDKDGILIRKRGFQKN